MLEYFIMATRKHIKGKRNAKKNIKKSNKKYIKLGNKNKTKRRGGMNNGKTKTLRFGEDKVDEFKTTLYPYDLEESYEESSIKDYRRCPHPKYMSRGTFPCRHHNTVFRTYEEFMEWIQMKKDASAAETSHGIDSEQHRRNIRDAKLITTGRWNKPIPPEYRIYNEETGEINDARLFTPDSDEERMFLAQQRDKRNKEKVKWMQDVARHKRDRPELYYDIDDENDY